MRLNLSNRESGTVKAAINNYGDSLKEEYECPCGKGIVVYERDNIVGHKHRQTDCHCKDCDKIYSFNRGEATPKN
ncbi:hypothetical protein [Terribacillus saccharophilus]|uniref:Uncharacterized protein n=1 Tax=Terribacillus saccharophilus TaxID=361277 RepID=A0ABX4H0X4_9BACI|nr:hypothetical protein [Terribacillus saccharophilus]PAD36336.1 hypothetical protein CHH56_04915 [Terribacillus saccharophilus]PAD95022.1 hypothetical protein CHH50_15570 [Terribacillus saccharophilus]PAE00755.1 hypothetical protein CHH48_05620 [Terribacillus saccharophilus]